MTPEDIHVNQISQTQKDGLAFIHTVLNESRRRVFRKKEGTSERWAKERWREYDRNIWYACMEMS